MKNEILETIEDLEINILDFDNGSELYEKLDYNGRMHEIIDGNIDIYYHETAETRKRIMKNLKIFDILKEKDLFDDVFLELNRFLIESL